MTTQQMNAAIGQRVQWRVGDVLVDCTVQDVKTAWGNVRLLVEPVAGIGQQWVELSRVRLNETGQALSTR